MSRYIDVDELLKCKCQAYDENGVGLYVVCTGNILRMPTADVVEVVRCKDCVYWEQATDNSGNCNRAFEITAYGSDYCSYGERRENGTT